MQIHTQGERAKLCLSLSLSLSISLRFQFHSLHCSCFALFQSNAFNLCTLVASPFAATPPPWLAQCAPLLSFISALRVFSFFSPIFPQAQHTHTYIARIGVVEEGEVYYPLIPLLFAWSNGILYSYTLNDLLRMYISIKLSFFIEFFFKGLLNRRLNCFIMAHTFFIAS